MKKMTTLLAVLTITFLTSCASTSTSLPKLNENISSACDKYEASKEKVETIRALAMQNWDSTFPGTDVPVIPSNAKELLLEYDAYLNEIDATVKVVCGFFEMVGPSGPKPAATDPPADADAATRRRAARH